MKITAAPFTGEQLARRILFLAYNTGSVFGMGALQARPSATEAEVWQAMSGATDYAGSEYMKPRAGKVNADYVMGRMLKLYFGYDADSVDMPDSQPSGDYQSWCRKYISYEALAQAALADLQEPV